MDVCMHVCMCVLHHFNHLLVAIKMIQYYSDIRCQMFYFFKKHIHEVHFYLANWAPRYYSKYSAGCKYHIFIVNYIDMLVRVCTRPCAHATVCVHTTVRMRATVCICVTVRAHMTVHVHATVYTVENFVVTYWPSSKCILSLRGHVVHIPDISIKSDMFHLNCSCSLFQSVQCNWSNVQYCRFFLYFPPKCFCWSPRVQIFILVSAICMTI